MLSTGLIHCHDHSSPLKTAGQQGDRKAQETAPHWAPKSVTKKGVGCVPVAYCSKVNKQARLMKAKVTLFQMLVSGREVVDIYQKSNSPQQVAGETFSRQKGGGYM